MINEAKKKAKKKYRQKSVKQINLEFYPTEKELIEHLEKQPLKATYIKTLIRNDIKKQEGKPLP